MGLPARVDAKLVKNVANSSVVLKINSIFSNKLAGEVSGVPDGNWDVATTVNWKLAPANTPSTYLQAGVPGEPVTFDLCRPADRPGHHQSQASVLLPAFGGDASFKVYYLSGNNGFTTPTWQGYPSFPGVPPQFSSAAPPATGKIGTPYSHTCTATGTPAPTFAVTSGALPDGLVLSRAGVISGTPSAAGVFTGTLTAANGIPPVLRKTSPLIPAISVPLSLA